jgi:hypothetical protein
LLTRVVGEIWALLEVRGRVGGHNKRADIIQNETG